MTIWEDIGIDYLKSTQRERMLAYHEWRGGAATDSMVAHHEAGHAVIARKLGINVDFVSANPSAMTFSGRRPGAITKIKLDNPSRIDSHRRNAIYGLAGPIAEIRFLNIDVGLNIRDSEDSDIISALNDIEHIACLRGIEELRGSRGKKSFVRREFHRLEAETVCLVEQHWCAIRRVAEVLEHHPLGDERCIPKKMRWFEHHPWVSDRNEPDRLIAG